MSKFILFNQKVIVNLEHLKSIYIDDSSSPPCVVADMGTEYTSILFEGETVDECEALLSGIFKLIDGKPNHDIN